MTGLSPAAGGRGLPAVAPGEFTRDPLGFLLRGHERFGPVFATRLDGVPAAIVGTFDGTAELFARERGHLQVANTALVHDLFGPCVFNLNGNDHARARRMLRPALAGEALRAYAPLLMRTARDTARRWAGQPVEDLYGAVRDVTLEASAQIILGIGPADADAVPFRRAFAAFVRATDAPGGAGRRLAPPYWAGLRARGVLRELFGRRAALSRSVPGPDALSGLAGPWREADPDVGTLEDHLLALLIAARETTASLITWCLIEIAEHPGLARRAAREAGQAAADPALLLDREALPVLRSMLAETERLHSPNMISLREVVRPCRIAGFDVPAGWHAAYSPSANHFGSVVFPDPFTFRPQRFDPRTRPGERVPALLTFGGGTHACLGKHVAELMTLAVAAGVLSRWRIRLPGGRPQRMRYLPAKAPTRPLPAVFEPVQEPA